VGGSAGAREEGGGGSEVGDGTLTRGSRLSGERGRWRLPIRQKDRVGHAIGPDWAARSASPFSFFSSIFLFFSEILILL
jgi:hypothetical protein